MSRPFPRIVFREGGMRIKVIDEEKLKKFSDFLRKEDASQAEKFAKIGEMLDEILPILEAACNELLGIFREDFSCDIKDLERQILHNNGEVFGLQEKYRYLVDRIFELEHERDRKAVGYHGQLKKN